VIGLIVKNCRVPGSADERITNIGVAGGNLRI